MFTAKISTDENLKIEQIKQLRDTIAEAWIRNGALRLWNIQLVIISNILADRTLTSGQSALVQ